MNTPNTPNFVELPAGYNRTKIKLKNEGIRFVIVLASSLLISFAVATFSQTKFRDFAFFQLTSNPQQTQENESQTQQNPLEEFWSKTKNYAQEKIGAVAQQSDFYQKIKEENNKFFKVADETAFWGPFFTTFFLAMILLYKLSHLVYFDPIDREEKKRLAKAINQLEKRVQDLESMKL